MVNNCKFGCGLRINPITGLLEFLGDSERGLECDPDANGGEGAWFVKVDGTSITFNSDGELQATAPDVCDLNVPHFIEGSAQDNTGLHTGETLSPGDTVKEFFVNFTNNDPCERDGEARIFINWEGFAFDSVAGQKIDIQFEFTVDGGTNWIETSDHQFAQPATSPGHFKTILIPIAFNQTLTIGARYKAGSTHNPGVVIGEIYNLQIDWYYRCGGI